jgi:phospholipase/lecithinase/hemolysin
MRASRLILTLILSASLGCAALFHRPRPDLELAMDERPWRVRCAWTLPPSGESPLPRDGGTEWASDSSKRRLVVTGRIQDGFFLVESLRAASDEDDRDVVPLPATAREVRRACIIALDRAVEGEQPRLHSAMATRDGEGIDVPMVFPGDPALPRPVSRMVVFGDSLSDPGNLKRKLVIFPNSPYWLGRFANGPNWTEYFADRTGVSVQNHAVGGAVAVKHENVPSESIIAAIQKGAQFFLTGSLDNQVKDYREQDLLGAPVKQPEETVYVLWGGANDYISKEPFTGEISTLLDDPDSKSGYRIIVEQAVASLESQVRLLYESGARHFVLLNLPDLGKTPIVLQNESYFPVGRKQSDPARRLQLSARLTQLTSYHNKRLATAHKALQRDLKGATISYVDTFKLVDQIFAGQAPGGSRQRFDYGFALDELSSEVRDGRKRARYQKRCYSGGYLGSLDSSTICAQSTSAMFWDIVHPTSYTHCWVAYFVQDQLAQAGLAAKPASVADQRAYCIARNQPSW